ncbi:PD-(D/E)XK nuclease family protein [Verrucomicrobium spinosum]|uniref:PD-(D/E)XK nuclease family protein n=2 Tax=Verrucomicrobium spinosum TaxID=2736 RepID=UPI00017458A1|nr:PD-(D/E)XK nuclease family protein [Verrucomicrobium spinosum]
MAGAKLTFWGWDSPVLHKAVAELSCGWTSGALDLSDTLIIVPTAETVRRLREALAVEAGARDSVVTAPHLWHAALVFQPKATTMPLASPLQERAAWTEVLAKVPLGEMTALFPAAPESQDLTWASAVAETVGTLRKTLGAGGYTLAAGAEALAGLDDPARWSQLARLEELYLETLEAWGLADGESAKQGAAREATLPEGVKQVKVFAVADAPPLFGVWLRHVSEKVPSGIFVQAPAEGRAGFDEIGMPRILSWGDDAGLECPLPHDRMHRVPGAEDQARLSVRLLGELAATGQEVAVGACDPALNSVLEGTLTSQGVRVYNPAGRSARQHGLVQVLRAGWRAARSASWRDWLPFLRLDDVSRALCAETGMLVTKYYEQLDEFDATHLPPTVRDAQSLAGLHEAWAELGQVLSAVVRHAEGWAAETCEGAVRNFLLWLYGETEFDSGREHQKHHGELFGQVVRLAMQMDEGRAAAGASSSPAEAAAWLGLVFDALEEGQLTDLRGEADLVLHGWLELLWEPAPGLVITGFNDEHVPGTLTADPFLPDKAKAALGLPCQATRRARDAYFLKAMAEQRSGSRTLHIVLGRHTAEGDALRPSRLLLDASDDDLPLRVKHLFPAEDEVQAPPRPLRTQAFQLTPPLRKWTRSAISPTALRRYLQCPFRFYLTDVLGMESVSTGLRELSPATVGDLIHQVFKAFADETAVAESRDAGIIAAWLEAELDRRAALYFGAEPLFSVTLQVESLRQRLAAFAEKQAELREQGWRILRAEEKIQADWGVDLGGVILSGKIDRIDRNDKTGMLRVIDYKTSRKKPEEAHHRSARKELLADENQSWKCFDDARGKARCWTDLQLPLYARAVSAKLADGAPVEAAYFLLPATVSEVKTHVWEGLDADLMDAAGDCACEAVRRIRDGVFWPPVEDLRFDDFAELFQGDVMKAVAPPESWLVEKVAEELAL